jgi:hypothetical protein
MRVSEAVAYMTRKFVIHTGHLVLIVRPEMVR